MRCISTKNNVMKLTYLLAYCLIDITARYMRKLGLHHQLYSVIFVFFDPPKTVLNFASTAQSLMRTILCSHYRAIHEIEGPISFKPIPHKDIVHFIAINIQVDLVEKHGVFFFYFSNQKNATKTVLPKFKVLMIDQLGYKPLSGYQVRLKSIRFPYNVFLIVEVQPVLDFLKHRVIVQLLYSIVINELLFYLFLNFLVIA